MTTNQGQPQLLGQVRGCDFGHHFPRHLELPELVKLERMRQRLLQRARIGHP